MNYLLFLQNFNNLYSSIISYFYIQVKLKLCLKNLHKNQTGNLQNRYLLRPPMTKIVVPIVYK